MKKYLILFLLFIVNNVYICYGQKKDGLFKKAEALHTAYLTKELGLTATESEAFWPVYRNYFSEIKVAWKDGANDQIALEEGLLNTRKKYKPEFKKVLGSDERVNMMFIAERKFRDLLKRELMNRRMKRQGIQQQQ